MKPNYSTSCLPKRQRMGRRLKRNSARHIAKEIADGMRGRTLSTGYTSGTDSLIIISTEGQMTAKKAEYRLNGIAHRNVKRRGRGQHSDSCRGSTRKKCYSDPPKHRDAGGRERELLANTVLCPTPRTCKMSGGRRAKNRFTRVPLGLT